ncbi:unnamed protein product [Ilex paraguariensis]|uniref:WAT1-related protein n=1 Tax=Ilex paraguariensis TaxID=185542 RepID=A0ABC8T057_9AQUA
MERAGFCYREVLPFVAVIISLGSNVGVTTAFKAAASQGISYRVFMVYAHSLAGLVLLPFAFIFERKKRLPPLNFSFINRIFLLGLIGFLGHTLGYMGLVYSTPTLSTIISNLTPAFTFALAIIFSWTP